MLNGWSNRLFLSNHWQLLYPEDRDVYAENDKCLYMQTLTIANSRSIASITQPPDHCVGAVISVWIRVYNVTNNKRRSVDVAASSSLSIHTNHDEPNSVCEDIYIRTHCKCRLFVGLWRTKMTYNTRPCNQWRGQQFLER